MNPQFFNLDSWQSCAKVLDTIRARWPHIEIAVYYDERHPEHTEEEEKNDGPENSLRTS